MSSAAPKWLTANTYLVEMSLIHAVFSKGPNMLYLADDDIRLYEVERNPSRKPAWEGLLRRYSNDVLDLKHWL